MDERSERPELQRAVGLPEAVVYGVGLILGAGVYAILGAAVGVTGGSVVVSFLVAALVATFTGMSYAELASRFPKSEGEYLYVGEAFESEFLSEIAAFGRVLTGVVSAAVVALAFGGYLSRFGPVSPVAAALGLVAVAAVVNFWGIAFSTRVNVAFTAIELLGLVFVVWLGRGALTSADVTHAPNGVTGVLSASFLVFFAYVGFESLVNLAEEMERPSEVLPRAIELSIVLTTLLYVLVGLAAVGLADWRVLGRSASPLAEVAAVGGGPLAAGFVAVVALFSTANTVLILFVSTSRLVYGVSKSEYRSLPSAFARIHPERRTPYLAVALVAAATVPFVLVGDLGFVAELANLALLVVFALVNASLLELRFEGDEANAPGTYRTPLNVGRVSLPAVGGLLSSVGLVAFYLLELAGALG